MSGFAPLLEWVADRRFGPTAAVADRRVSPQPGLPNQGSRRQFRHSLSLSPSYSLSAQKQTRGKVRNCKSSLAWLCF